MFKNLAIRKKKKSDVRFIDGEIYRAQRKPLKHLSAQKKNNAQAFNQHAYTGHPSFADLLDPTGESDETTLSFYRNRSGAPLASISDIDTAISVEEGTGSNSKPLNKAGKKDLFDLFVEESSRAKEIVDQQISLEPTVLGPNFLCKNSLGIFCDSKMYSALIKNELLEYRLDVRHFNHPRTFVKSRYAYFDRISAWLLFLSDECDEAFIDSFLDRYSDKPTLFLCPKMSRKGTTERIREFIATCDLEKETDLSDELIELI